MNVNILTDWVIWFFSIRVYRGEQIHHKLLRNIPCFTTTIICWAGIKIVCFNCPFLWSSCHWVNTLYRSIINVMPENLEWIIVFDKNPQDTYLYNKHPRKSASLGCFISVGNSWANCPVLAHLNSLDPHPTSPHFYHKFIYITKKAHEMLSSFLLEFLLAIGLCFALEWTCG